MRERLLLGPVMIALLVGGLALDQWLDKQPLPAWAQTAQRATWPPGVVILIGCLALSILAARELAAIFIGKGVVASRRILTFAAALGLLVSCLVQCGVSVIDAVAAVRYADII